MKKLILFLAVGIFLVELVGAEKCLGGADLDISRIERTPGQPIFKVIAVANGNGDCLKIAWARNDLNTLLNKESPDELTDRDIIGDIKLISQTEKWNTYSYAEFYNYNVDEDVGYFYCESKCSEKGYPTSLSEGGQAGWSLWSGCYCVYKDNLIGSVGMIGSRSLNDKVLFSFTGLPDTYLDTSEGSGEIGDKINVAYRGSLIGTKFLDEPSIYSPFKKSDGQFILVSGNEALGDSFVMDLIDCINISESSSDSQNCISKYDSRISSFFLTDKTNDWASNQQGIIKGAYFDGEDFIAEKNIYSTQWPEFTLTFDAEWAGVHWITGQPKVICPKDKSFMSGDSETISFDIENVDSEKGAFSLSFVCEGLSVVLDENKILLDSSQSKTITSQVTASSDLGKKGECTFKAQATRDPSKSDECSFKVEVEKRKMISNKEAETSPGITGRVIGGSSSTGIAFLIIFVILVGGAIWFFYFKKNKTSVTPSSSANSLCPSCNAPIESGRKFCTNCGEKVKDPSNQKRCPSCAKLNPGWRKFCIECGKGLKK